MTQNDLNLAILKPTAAILGLFGLGLWLSFHVAWLGWLLSLGALVLFGFRASIEIGALVVGLFFAGLAVWGAMFGLGREGGGESVGWVLLVGLGSLAILAGVGVWSRCRVPGALIMAAGLVSMVIGLPPVLPMVGGMLVTWFGVSLVRRFTIGV